MADLFIVFVCGVMVGAAVTALPALMMMRGRNTVPPTAAPDAGEVSAVTSQTSSPAGTLCGNKSDTKVALDKTLFKPKGKLKGF